MSHRRPLRIVFLSSDDAHQQYLAAQVHERFDLVALVVEPASSQRKRLLRERKFIDWTAATYHAWRRRLLGLNAYRKRYFALPTGAPIWPPVQTINVDWINDPAVVQLLREITPDICLLMCTSILRKPVLEAAGTIVNIHGGFLPYYRGNHCFFFALYHGAIDRIGSTIHFVDEGVDTGDIIEHVIPTIYPDDNAEKLYCRAEKLAIHRLMQLLEGLQNGVELPRRPQPPGGKQYYTRDRTPLHDILHPRMGE